MEEIDVNIAEKNLMLSCAGLKEVKNVQDLGHFNDD
jgi:hypothetical protein